MLDNKTILLVSSVFILGSCSSVSGMFSKKETAPKLEGERISVLELQNKLTPDAGAKEGHEIKLPQSWINNAWSQAGGYPTHIMQNLSLPNGNIKRVWSANIGSGSSKDIPLTAQPIVINNTAYTLDTNSRLSAFNATTGKKIWKVNVEKKNEDNTVIGGGIAFANGMLYVTNGYDEVLAVKSDNGEIIWRKPLPSPSRAAPTATNGRVFISTINSRLVALNAKDGASLWEYTGISEMAGLLGAASPAANNEIVIPVFSSGEITALRVENGSVAWSDNLSNVRSYGGGIESISDIKAMPLLGNGIIIAISFGGKLVAIDERTGARIWQRDISGSQTPWVAGNHVYVLSSENQLIALNITNGSIVWINELASFENEKKKKDPINWSGPVMASGELILAGSHGYMVRVNALNGKLTQRIRTKKNVQIPPIITNETLYLLSEDGTLVAYK